MTARSGVEIGIEIEFRDFSLSRILHGPRIPPQLGNADRFDSDPDFDCDPDFDLDLEKEMSKIPTTGFRSVVRC